MDETKLFQRGQHHGVFGWDSFVAMYQREASGAKQNLIRMVPRLKEVHAVRDSWTKLNVSPAKIMQVNCYLTVHVCYLTYDAARTSLGRIVLSSSTTNWC